MAPLDWDKLMALDVGNLVDNTDEADDMYSILAEVCGARILKISLYNSQYYYRRRRTK